MGRARQPDAQHGAHRNLGDLHARPGRRGPLQVRDSFARGASSRPEIGPVWFFQRSAAEYGVGGLRHQPLRMERLIVAGGSKSARLAALADVDLRNSRGSLEAQGKRRVSLAHLPRTGRRAGALRQADGLHAYRTDADHGTSLRRVVGLSDGRILCGDSRFGTPVGFHVFRRPVPSGRPRRDSRLDARAFSARRARPRVLRRHAPLRARRPEAGRASGLGHAGFQLRAQRGAELSAVERAFLDRQISHRRAARGCGGVDALSRLFAQGG